MCCIKVILPSENIDTFCETLQNVIQKLFKRYLKVIATCREVLLHWWKIKTKIKTGRNVDSKFSFSVYKYVE